LEDDRHWIGLLQYNPSTGRHIDDHKDKFQQTDPGLAERMFCRQADIFYRKQADMGSNLDRLFADGQTDCSYIYLNRTKNITQFRFQDHYFLFGSHKGNNVL
jgi:hypothetical protein